MGEFKNLFLNYDDVDEVMNKVKIFILFNL